MSSGFDYQKASEKLDIYANGFEMARRGMERSDALRYMNYMLDPTPIRGSVIQRLMAWIDGSIAQCSMGILAQLRIIEAADIELEKIEQAKLHLKTEKE